jgi:UDP-3-O-[3-hydroxymyristoyl] glucosamine N-acyltransferase
MKLAELARKLGGTLTGEGGIDIVDVAPLDEAGPGMLTFLADARYAAKLRSTRASAVLLATDAPDVGLPAVRVAHPYVAFVMAVELFHPPRRPEPGIHPTAVIAPTARIGPGASIGPHVVVGDDVRLGREAVLHPNVTIYPRAEIGDGFTAHAGVVVREDVRIGSRVTLHAGVVIGSDGFGYLPLPEGNRKIPQVGTVVIEDEVEIGANSTVDRAALGATVIARGTKIDNLVQISHGCRVGHDSLIAAQVGLGGGTTLGARVMLGGQVGAAGHLRIGDGAKIGAKAGVHQDIPPGGVYSGYPAIEGRLWRRVSASLPRLPGVLRRLRRIEQALGLAPKGDDE